MERVLRQLIIHEQDGRAVSRDDNAGRSILGRIDLPARSGDGRGAGSLDRAANRTGPISGVVIHIGGRGAGVIILLEHVDDRIMDSRAVPLGIQCRVGVDSNSASDLFRQLLVRIPAREGVAAAGRVRSRQIDTGAIRNSRTADIAAAVGLIAQLEALARVLDRQFLSRSLRDVCAFGKLKYCVIIALDRRGNIAVQNAVLVLSLDLGIAVSGEILQHVDEVILCRIGDILETDLKGGRFIFEVVFRDFDRRSLRIVDRSAGNLVCAGLCRCRSRDRIRQLTRLDLQQVGVEDELATGIVEIVVLRSDVIHIDRAEHRNDRHVASDDRISVHFRIGALDDPLLKDLAGHEGILRHRADFFTRRTEVLRQALGLGAVVIHDHKVHSILVVEHCRDRHVAGNLCLGRNRIAVLIYPADKVLAFNDRISRKLKSVTLVEGVGLVRLAVGHKRDGENALVIFGPDAHVSGDLHGVAKVSVFVDPLAVITRLRRNSRDVVQTIAGVGVDRLGGNLGRLVFLIESDRVRDLVIVRDDGRIGFGNKACTDARAGDLDLLALAAGDDFADRPEGIVVFACDCAGKLIADGLALHDVNRLIDLGVTVIERNGPGLGRLVVSVGLHRCAELDFIVLNDRNSRDAIGGEARRAERRADSAHVLGGAALDMEDLIGIAFFSLAGIADRDLHALALGGLRVVGESHVAGCDDLGTFAERGLDRGGVIAGRGEDQLGALFERAFFSDNAYAHAADRAAAFKNIRVLFRLLSGLGCDLGRRLGCDLGRRLGCDLGRRLGCDLGRRLGCDLGRRLGCDLGLIRLFSRIRILRKLDHIIILVSAVVQAGGQGLIAGPQYHQQGKQKREYALRQFVHLMRASYSLRGGGSRRRALFTALWVLLVRCHWVLLCTLRLLCCLQ